MTTTEWIWLDDQPLAVVVDAATASPRLPRRGLLTSAPSGLDDPPPCGSWMHTDQLGTPQKLTDQAQAVLWDGIGEPFGALASLVTGLVDQPLRLPGQYAEPLTGLHQNWHRDYDPDLGRYLQPDPIGIAGGSNLYGYVSANPGWIDRDGRNPIAWGKYGGDIGSVAGLPFGLPGVWAGRILGTTIGAGAGYCAMNWDQIDRWLNQSSGEAKALGVPGPQEGYFPPKNWDGKMVPNPNGPGRGWPDKDGNVWVPTGPGAKAHGGPQWDVQKAGGGYDNVYPGGRRRASRK